LAFPPLEAQAELALLQSLREQWASPQQLAVLPLPPEAAVLPALFAAAASLHRQAWKSWRGQFLV
jgi:hypothetical protein